MYQGHRFCSSSLKHTEQYLAHSIHSIKYLVNRHINKRITISPSTLCSVCTHTHTQSKLNACNETK